MGRDLHQTQFLEGKAAKSPDYGGHDASSPERLRQPVADLRQVGYADLEAIEATPANQGFIGAADGEIHRTALLFRVLDYPVEPVIGILSVYGKGIRRVRS